MCVPGGGLAFAEYLSSLKCAKDSHKTGNDEHECSLLNTQIPIHTTHDLTSGCAGYDEVRMFGAGLSQIWKMQNFTIATLQLLDTVQKKAENKYTWDPAL